MYVHLYLFQPWGRSLYHHTYCLLPTCLEEVSMSIVLRRLDNRNRRAPTSVSFLLSTAFPYPVSSHLFTLEFEMLPLPTKRLMEPLTDAL